MLKCTLKINKFWTINFGQKYFRWFIFGQFPLLVRQTLYKNVTEKISDNLTSDIQ